MLEISYDIIKIEDLLDMENSAVKDLYFDYRDHINKYDIYLAKFSKYTLLKYKRKMLMKFNPEKFIN